jgi:LCP family protein required for cell wall assembly
MVSIPRDSYLPIPGYGEDKINAAFVVGGAPLLAQTVEQATGIRLDHYAEIGFDGFAVLVDAVGGVTMCPTEPISDPLAGIDLPAGCQKLDGRNALGYVRTRATPRADLDRMMNQRQFMSALLHRAQPGRAAQSAALVSDKHAASGLRSTRVITSGIWRGWRGRCVATSRPRLCRSASSPAATPVRSWCGTATPRASCSPRWRPTRRCRRTFSTPASRADSP